MRLGESGLTVRPAATRQTPSDVNGTAAKEEEPPPKYMERERRNNGEASGFVSFLKLGNIIVKHQPGSPGMTGAFECTGDPESSIVAGAADCDLSSPMSPERRPKEWR